jgi:hypothetical protein
MPHLILRHVTNAEASVKAGENEISLNSFFFLYFTTAAAAAA